MKKTWKITALLIVAALLLTSCGLFSGVAKGSIKAGKWDESIFSNEWSNVKLTLPSGYKSLTPQEMKDALKAGEEVVFNDNNQVAVDLASMRTLYDFMIIAADQVSNIFLCYENVKMIPGADKMDAEGYNNALKEQLQNVTQISYTFLPSGTATVAGESYFVGKSSINNGNLYQDYYIRKLDDAFIVFMVTYTDSSKPEIDRFLQSITKAK